MINACIDWCFGDKGLCLSKDALFPDWMAAFYIFPFLSAPCNYLLNVLVCVGVFFLLFFFFFLTVSSNSGRMFKPTNSSEAGEISV